MDRYCINKGGDTSAKFHKQKWIIVSCKIPDSMDRTGENLLNLIP